MSQICASSPRIYISLRLFAQFSHARGHCKSRYCPQIQLLKDKYYIPVLGKSLQQLKCMAAEKGDLGIVAEVTQLFLIIYNPIYSLFYKSEICLHNLHNKCVTLSPNSQCSSHSLRNTETVSRLPKKKSADGQKCFSFRAAKLWNNLPAETSTASSFTGFKKFN